MYTLIKNGNVHILEKEAKRKGDNFAAVKISVTHYTGDVKVSVHVFAFTSPFMEKSRSHSQFFEGEPKDCLKEAWKLFKGFQELLGGDFND